MTDERNNSKINNNKSSSSSNNSNVVNNNSSNNNNNNNDSERIIAEAAKILLKNGLNGTNAAAAATLLTAAAAATFQLPAPPPLFVSASSTATTTTTAAATTTNGLLPFVTTISANNRTTSSPSARAMTTATASAPVATAPKTELGGVLDYTLGNVGGVSVAASIAKNAGGLQKVPTTNHYETGRQPLSTASSNTNLGGRLQFFKDGKFILELARSKDGEKGGWVSVPRKTFRAPSAATSATVTPTSAAVAPATYPKNENSTSLSFSDDNSSIQSSPWQRDHSWKQSRPRRGISKEMSLFYQRPKSLVLTKCGLKTAAKKRRKPYENTKTAPELFEHVKQNLNKSCTEDNVSIKVEQETDVMPAEVSPKAETKPNSNELKSTDIIKDASLKNNLNTADINLCKDVSSENGSKKESEGDATVEITCETTPVDDSVINDKIEKISTSEGGDGAPMLTDMDEQSHLMKLSKGTVVNGTVSEPRKLETNTDTAMETNDNDDVCTKSNGSVDSEATIVIKQKNQKSRAKLTTIIQKLIDNVPARLEQLSKLTTVANTVSGSGGGVINSLSHTLTQKVSPPTSAATRLVESYHQQHVSPRKRILREFEKVSLEDNNVNNGAGGKRSRAKGGSTPKSSPSRCSASPMSSANAAAGITGGNNSQTVTSKASLPTPTPSTPSTRLNSSYSIHSLLGGSSSLSSKKTNDQPATIISNVLQQQQQQLAAAQLYTNSAYSRALLTSPKSPDSISISGGKSPSSHPSLSKKRSPPYAASSPLHETHSRSPTVSHDYGRRTPPDANAYKMQLIHQQQQQQQQQHHHHQTFYPPPYAMSPQYVPPQGLAHSPTITVNASRMPISTLSSTISPHIPPHASLATRDLSPPRAQTASPREPATTPRTVPKKTASIRREFASPTASNSSTATSCPSPGDRSIASPERKANTIHHPSSTATGSPLHYYLYPPPSNGATSPHAGTVSTSMVQPPPPPPILATSQATSSSAAAVAAAAAAAAAAYIPSVVTPTLYHPYISTLAALRHNPLWLHHYQAGPAPLMPPTHSHAVTTPSVSASHRLSPPFHPLAYNGVVAAAAAAAAFGQHPAAVPPSASHLLHSSASSAALQGLQQHQPQSSGISGLTEHRNHTPTKLTDTSSGSSGSSALMRTYATSVAAPVTNSIGADPAAHYLSSSLRDELSSDVPLNLSKH